MNEIYTWILWDPPQQVAAAESMPRGTRRPWVQAGVPSSGNVDSMATILRMVLDLANIRG